MDNLILKKYLEYSKLSLEELKILEDTLSYEELLDFSLFVFESNKELFDLPGIKYLDYLLVQKIWDKFSNDNPLNEKEVKALLYSKYYSDIEDLDIGNMNIIMEFCDNDDSRLEGRTAVCLHNLKREKFILLYSKNLIEEVVGSLDFTSMYYALTSMGHELIHVAQQKEEVTTIDLNTFIIALEQVATNQVKNFYYDNYEFLKSELDAEGRGYISAYNFFEKFHLYNPDILPILKEISYSANDKCNSKFFTHQIKVNGKVDDIARHLFFITEKSLKFLHFYTDFFPILNIGYNEQGKLKSISELIMDRQEIINSGPEILSNYDEIYAFILDKCYGMSITEASEIVRLEKDRKMVLEKSLFRRVVNKLNKNNRK